MNSGYQYKMDNETLVWFGGGSPKSHLLHKKVVTMQVLLHWDCRKINQLDLSA